MKAIAIPYQWYHTCKFEMNQHNFQLIGLATFGLVQSGNLKEFDGNATSLPTFCVNMASEKGESLQCYNANSPTSIFFSLIFSFFPCWQIRHGGKQCKFPLASYQRVNTFFLSPPLFVFKAKCLWIAITPTWFTCINAMYYWLFIVMSSQSNQNSTSVFIPTTMQLCSNFSK